MLFDATACAGHPCFVGEDPKKLTYYSSTTSDDQDLRNIADKGDADAQYNLGTAYENGRGVPKDNVQALKWFMLAAAHSNHTSTSYNAASSRDALERGMTPAQIAQAKKLASEWKPTGG